MYDKYIGIPYKESGRDENGIDCWGLARLFYKQELGIDLPSYETETVRSFDPKLSKSVEEFISNWTKTAAPKLGDLCLFNILGEPIHVGLYLENGRFLHAREGHSSVIESIKKPNWNKRLEGIYTYTPVSKAIQLTGSPHPFKINKIVEFTQPGTTVKQCVEFISEKYKLSERLFKQINVAIDGVNISRDSWATTVLRTGQLVTYKIIPQGGGGGFLRQILMFAVTIFVAIYLPELLPTLTKLELALVSAAVTMAGVALINAIVPIRMPELNQQNVETGAQLSLYNGSSNRANPYGSIPVVLGRVRMTPYLGAQLYVDTQTSTSYAHMQLVWGFGPLYVDRNQLYVGANTIDSFYQTGTGSVLPQPVTVAGYIDSSGVETETSTISRFNRMYPNIVEQQAKNVELVNDTINGVLVNNEEVITFQETEATKVNVVISFPEGCRKIDQNTGGSSNVSVEFLLILERMVNGVAQPLPMYSSGTTYSERLEAPFYQTLDTDSDGNSYYVSRYVYQKVAYCITPRGGIGLVKGTVSMTQGNPSGNFLQSLKDPNFVKLLPSDAVTANYLFEPQIPGSWRALYTLVVYNRSIVEGPTNVVTTSYNYSGWTLTAQQEYGADYTDDVGNTYTGVALPSWTINLQAGTLGSPKPGTPGYIAPQPNGLLPSFSNIWSTRNISQASPVTNSLWGATFGDLSFMNTYAVKDNANSTTLDKTITVQFPYYGVYVLEAQLEGNSGFIDINGTRVDLPANSSRSGSNGILIKLLAFNPGTGTIRTYATGTSVPAVAARITYSVDNNTNFVSGSNYLTIGDNEFYNYKDGFNYTVTWNNLVAGQYRVRVKRTSSSNPDIPGGGNGYKAMFRTSLLAGSAFKAGTAIVPPKGVGICRTGIVLESSGKANGTVDGVNALVQSIGWDYVLDPVGGGRSWQYGFISNNPASLFINVLTHPANAYKVGIESINLDEIADWHTYCATAVENIRPVLTFNAIISNTTSVLSVIRDICAAGMASPVFIDGKWSVVIDRPRPYVIQHFTPHNSWEFRAVKNLPKLPDAFRVSFPDETNAYQATEVLIANFGRNISNAIVIEELNLPGITRIEQARYFARWHFAQLKYRPETFTINTDFEYLICTRGDRVKVTHDVPQWGVSSGRIKSITADKQTLQLTEPVALEAGKSYQIRIRTDNLTATGGGSIERSFTVATTAVYDTIGLSSAVDASVKVDDLFMIGELNKVTQDLLVQTIEPTSNNSAKITLVEYTESIYNFQFRPQDDETPYLPSYVPLFTKRIGSELIKNTILSAPIITDIRSEDILSREISTGNYQNVVIITWQNTNDLPLVAEKVEFQIIQANENFVDNLQSGVHVVNKDAGSYTTYGLSSNTAYKVRARYRNAGGSISGPWGEEYSVVVIGKSNNPFVPDDVSITFQDTFIYVKPVLHNGKTEPNDFETYEFRILKCQPGTNPEDFWSIVTTGNPDILVSQSRTQAVFNLLDFKPSSTNQLISSAGVRYKIACRAINKTKSYSNSSALGSILIKTIQ